MALEPGGCVSAQFLQNHELSSPSLGLPATLELRSSLLKWVLSCPNHMGTSGKVEDRSETWVSSVSVNANKRHLLLVFPQGLLHGRCTRWLWI